MITTSLDNRQNGGDSIDIITDNDDKFNNTIHLLDFLSELILNTANDPNADSSSGKTNNQNISMKLTFEETMQNLDAIISQIDQDLKLTIHSNNQADNAGVFKQPRLDDSKSAGQLSSGNNLESLEKYQALLELKEILDKQFKHFDVVDKKEPRSENDVPSITTTTTTTLVTPFDETFKDNYQDLINIDSEKITKLRDEL